MKGKTRFAFFAYVKKSGLCEAKEEWAFPPYPPTRRWAGVVAFRSSLRFDPVPPPL